MPGGFGTLDELSESFDLIQTKKSTIPYCHGRQKILSGMIDWLWKVLVAEKMIHEEDLDLLTWWNTPEEAVAVDR